MPKHLYLLRHAEAGPKESGQDKRRELTPAGIRDALQLGTWFREQNIVFDLIISSSAMRAEQTAEIVAEGMKIENPRILAEDSLYEASVRQLLDYINNIEDNCDQVLCVGHNPSISYLAEYLTKADIGDMEAASLVIIKFELPSWKLISQNTGQLVHHVTPAIVNRAVSGEW
jgi:phosphohistidine phosphatase